MSSIVEHQLKRAAASGGTTIGQAPVEVAPLVAELRATLMKVYAQKDFSIETSVAAQAQFIGDRGDLMEVLGNLLDNACKWCRGRVVLTVTRPADGTPREGLQVTVEDDGFGISEGDRARVFDRGVRADEKTQGYGIGLAMVRDTVELYGGTLAVDASRLGGARLILTLPGRQTLNSIP
jgi:two-component system sensor histidine kinase PhoQ